MHNAKWFGAIFLAFLAGYFSHLFFANNNLKTHIAPLEHSTASQSSAFTQRQTITINFESPDRARNPSTNTSSAHSASSTAEQQAPKNTNQIDTENQPPENTAPTPFDGLLKQTDNPLSEKYKAYLANEGNKQDDWDIQMQGKITDFILSCPAATDIKINRINCHLNMCEIQLQEQKKFVLMASFAELLQEPWITSTSTGQFYFNDNNGYMLLMRK